MAMVAVTAVSVGTALYSGYSANKSAKKQASLMEQQGQLQYEDALREGARIRDEGYRTQQKQVMEYIGSGVEIVGTALLVATETERLAEEEAYWTEKRGASQSDLANANAKITRSEGKAAMIASVGQAVGAGVNTWSGMGNSFGMAPHGTPKTGGK
jgi:hypothetical protein